MIESILRDGWWSGVAALGFAMLFNVPRRTLLGCVIAGAAGHAVRTLLMGGGASIEGASLGGAVCVGFLSAYFARRWRTPAVIFSVSGVIPMIPGRFAYGAMIAVLRLAELGSAAPESVLLDATVNAVKTALILGVLALGIAAPSLVMARHRPRV